MLKLEGRWVQRNAIVVDVKGRFVYDKAQPAVLRLSSQVFRFVASSGSCYSRVVSGHEIRAFNCGRR